MYAIENRSQLARWPTGGYLHDTAFGEEKALRWKPESCGQVCCKHAFVAKLRHPRIAKGGPLLESK